MTPQARSPLLNVMVRAAQKAARALVRDFGEVEQLQVSRKGPGDFVSAADLRAEQILKEELGRARPAFGFLMEESGASPAPDAGGGPSRGRWIVDPLDGTTNFLHGLPHWAISIGLEIDDQITAGVIYDPIKDELFAAERGGGAWMNARRLRVSGRRQLADAVIATGIPTLNRAGGHGQFLEQLDRVMAGTSGVRRFGSAALDLAYVAAGRYDGYWENGLKPWDVAAGLLLVTEAGGWVGQVGGSPAGARGGTGPLFADSVLAANTDLYQALDRMLTGAPAATGRARA